MARPPGRIIDQYREAASYARHSTGLLTAYALTAVVCGLAYPVFQLTAVFSARVYHAGPGQYGLLCASYGAGAVTGALLLSVYGAHRPRGQVMPVVVGVQALAVVAFGLARSFWLGAPLLVVIGAGSLCPRRTRPDGDDGRPADVRRCGDALRSARPRPLARRPARCRGDRPGAGLRLTATVARHA